MVKSPILGQILWMTHILCRVLLFPLRFLPPSPPRSPLLLLCRLWIHPNRSLHEARPLFWIYAKTPRTPCVGKRNPRSSLAFTLSVSFLAPFFGVVCAVLCGVGSRRAHALTTSHSVRMHCLARYSPPSHCLLGAVMPAFLP